MKSSVVVPVTNAPEHKSKQRWCYERVCRFPTWRSCIFLALNVGTEMRRSFTLGTTHVRQRQNNIVMLRDKTTKMLLP
jgi:hypothetical protein